jgi:hypothetical protein
MAAAKNNSIFLTELQQNIIKKGMDSTNQNNANLNSKLSIYLSILEKELNDLEIHNSSNLNLKLQNIIIKLEELLFMFVDVLNIIKIRNKDEIILRLKNLFKKKIIDFSKFINTISESVMKNSNRIKMILNLLNLQNQLNNLYELYEIHLKNSNVSTKNLIKKHLTNIQNKYKKFFLN